MVEVCLDELDAASTALRNAANGLGAIDLATPAQQVPAALDGSATGIAVLGTTMRLAAAVGVYAERVLGMSEAARDCAAAYRSTDDDVAALLQRIGPE